MAWYFVYTGEAHPGAHVGHHTSFEVKCANARLLRHEGGIRRPILLDDLAGTAHHAYGLVLNRTDVIGCGGRLNYRADWTAATNVASFLTRYEEQRRHRPARGGRSPYVSEQLEYRDQDREAFDERLRRNGPRSYDEFRRAYEIWRERG